MGMLADRLNTMEVSAVSPDGNISGRLRNRSEVVLAFRPGSYGRYSEYGLADQLGGLARLLWAGRTREYYVALSEAFGETISHETPAVSERDRVYRAARDELIAEGKSADGSVYVGVQGMRAWVVRIADGTIRELDEDEFGMRVYEASHAMITDQFAKIRQLKDYVYAGDA